MSNERWFDGGSGTAEENRVLLLTFSRHIEADPNFQTQVRDNPDPQNRRLAFQKILSNAMCKHRKEQLEMYKQYNVDDAFRQALQDALWRILGV